MDLVAGEFAVCGDAAEDVGFVLDDCDRMIGASQGLSDMRSVVGL